jgi:hypothetical protein
VTPPPSRLLARLERADHLLDPLAVFLALAGRGLRMEEFFPEEYVTAEYTFENEQAGQRRILSGPGGLRGSTIFFHLYYMECLKRQKCYARR